jgi:putative ABC transport system permease protein
MRTSLSYLATLVLSIVICGVFSILGFVDAVTEEKAANLKVIVTEKNQIPSQMPPLFEDRIVQLIKELGKENPEVRLENGDADIMTWAFVGGTLDPKNRTFQNSLFFFCMQPRKVLTMMDGLDELTEEEMKLLSTGVELMEQNPRGIILGVQRLRMLNKRVGDRIKLTSLNYKDLVFDMEIVGTFPEGTRYDQSAVMHREYLYKALEEYEGKTGKHPLADKCLNLIWLRMPTREAFEKLATEVNKPGRFSPAIKMETASSGISSWLDYAKDMLWGMRYLLCPALLVVMALVISNAISISVRERRTEMAVLKVLGFQPWMVMGFVLGEAILIGALSGFMASATAFSLVNAIGGVPFPIAFFSKFMVPASALWWGPALGAGAAFIGSFLPAWSARKVKVSEVFSKVA